MSRFPLRRSLLVGSIAVVLALLAHFALADDAPAPPTADTTPAVTTQTVPTTENAATTTEMKPPAVDNAAVTAESKPPVTENAAASAEVSPPVAENAAGSAESKPPVAENAATTAESKPPVATNAAATAVITPPIAENASATADIKPPVPENAPATAEITPPVTENATSSAENPSPVIAPPPPAPLATAPSPAPRIPDRLLAHMGGGQTITLTVEEQRFVELTNNERVQHGLKALIIVPLLVTTARDKSREMHDLNYWGHTSPTADKRTAMPRVLKALKEPPASMLVGENLYYCSRVLIEEGHQALMNSPTHRKNILNPAYQYLGIGAYISDDGRFWVTEHFLDIKY